MSDQFPASTTTPAHGALLSECGRYRYRLWRVWDDLAPVMVWVMKFARARATSVKVNIRCARPIHCFRQTDGRPWHPLYLPYDSPLEVLK